MNYTNNNDGDDLVFTFKCNFHFLTNFAVMSYLLAIIGNGPVIGHTFILNGLFNAVSNDGDDPVIMAEDLDESGGQLCMMIFADLCQGFNHREIFT